MINYSSINCLKNDYIYLISVVVKLYDKIKV